MATVTTLRDIIQQFIDACGPVMFADIKKEVKVQYGFVEDYIIAGLLNTMIMEEKVKLYDTGTAFDTGDAEAKRPYTGEMTKDRRSG